jgi:hypothetical protein
MLKEFANYKHAGPDGPAPEALQLDFKGRMEDWKIS